MKNASLAGAPPPSAYQLDPARIIETAEKLARSIGASLPGSVLAGLAVELVRIARDTDRQVRQARRPILVIRIASVTAIGCGLLGIGFLLNRIHFRWEFGSTFTELFEVTGAAVNFLVMLSGALWFLVTFENRVKCNRALASIQELREFIHVVDATQLYYTPDMYDEGGSSANKLRRFDHTYLLYCSQILGLVGNLAALHTRGAAGDSIMRASADVEMFATALTGKLYNKAEFVRLSAKSDSNIADGQQP